MRVVVILHLQEGRESEQWMERIMDDDDCKALMQETESRIKCVLL